MEQKKRWRAAGRICTGFGMTLIFCALALAGRHIWSEYRARESVEQLLSHMNQSITASAADRTAQEADADVQDTSDTPASPGVNESSGANGTSESTGMTGTTGTADSPGTNESPGATGANASTGMTGTTGANTSTGETDTAEQAREPFPDGLLGRLDIPSLELELPVWDSYTEDLLKQSVCRYGEELCEAGKLIIAGHNYKSHFGSLTRIAVGDTLTLTDKEGKASEYTVTRLENVGGNDLDLLLEGDWDLTLFTCSLSGSKRLLVRCVQIQ